MSGDARYNRRVSGLTLVELIIVMTLIAFIIPSVTMMLVRTLNSYETMWSQNKVSSSANFSLSRFTDDVNNLASIQTAEENRIDFTSISETYVTYRLDSGKLQYCISDDEDLDDRCNEDDEFGNIAQNVSIDESEIKYYLLDEESGMTLRNGEGLDQIRFVELVLVISSSDAPGRFSTVVHPDFLTE